MNIMNNQAIAAIKGLIGKEQLEKQVTKQWQKKAKCLSDLNNENKAELKKLKLQLLSGLEFEGQPASILFEELKESQKITKEQKKFAKFLYDNYSKHSIKAMGFD